MASGAPVDGQPLGRLRRALTAIEAPAETLLAVCASPSVVAALAAARPNPADASDDAAELLRRVAAVAGTVQAALDALSGGQAVESRVTRRHGSGFESLPETVALCIFAALPADQRARCAAVCRGWRVMLLQSSAWVRLDLSESCGVTQPINDALLQAASARARGQLRSLSLWGSKISYEVVHQVAQANGATLRELSYTASWLSSGQLDALLSAAPSLDCLFVSAKVSCDVGVRLLRNEAPFGPLVLLGVNLDGPMSLQDLCAALRAHERHGCLEHLVLRETVVSAEAMDTLVDVIAAGEFFVFKCAGCSVTAASVCALARLLTSSSALEHLFISNSDVDDAPLLDSVAGALLATALEGNNTLLQLSLRNVSFWADAEAAAAMLGAVKGHPSLCSLILSRSTVGDAAQAGAQLAAVIAANASALTELGVDGVAFGVAGMAPVLDALAQNTHLRKLMCKRVGMSEAFARDRFLPAVQANTSLRFLDAGSGIVGELPGRVFVQQAEALVAARSAADAAA